MSTTPPEFSAATLPPPQQWAKKEIWRTDLNCFQVSDGVRWISSVQVGPQGSLLNAGAPVSLGSKELSSVVRDGSNRVTQFSIGGVTFNITYASGSIGVTNTNGISVNVTLDGGGRISGIA